MELSKWNLLRFLISSKRWRKRIFEKAEKEKEEEERSRDLEKHEVRVDGKIHPNTIDALLSSLQRDPNSEEAAAVTHLGTVALICTLLRDKEEGKKVELVAENLGNFYQDIWEEGDLRRVRHSLIVATNAMCRVLDGEMDLPELDDTDTLTTEH